MPTVQGREKIYVCAFTSPAHIFHLQQPRIQTWEMVQPTFSAGSCSSVNVTEIAATLPRRPGFSLRISPQVTLLIKTKHQTLVLEVTGASVLPVNYKCEYTPIRVPVHLEV